MQLVVLVCSLAAVAVVYSQADQQSEELEALLEFCSSPRNQVYCDRLAELIQHARQQQQQPAMVKRKPSFVRFGKRSVDAEAVEGSVGDVEKRKPSFVRFGRK